MKWQQTRTDDRAVILQTEVSVLAGPDSRDTLLFKLHEGTVVHLERSEEGWSLIRLSDGRRGWLRGEGLERIVPVLLRKLARSRSSTATAAARSEQLRCAVCFPAHGRLIHCGRPEQVRGLAVVWKRVTFR